MKKLIAAVSILLTVLILITSAPHVFSASVFSDVTQNDWFYTPVNYCYNIGVVYGVAPGKFAPYQNATRGQFVTFIGRMAGNRNVSSYPFTDCPKNAYYTPYVNWSSKAGIVAGIDNTHFAPDDNITREQAFAIIYRLLKYYYSELITYSIPSKYKDADKVSDWAREAVGSIICYGIVNGDEFNNINPDKNITRAEVVQILYKYNEFTKNRTDTIDSHFVIKQSVLGVDISAYQGGITAAGILNGGGNFAILRMWYDSYGVTENGVQHTDRYFSKYYNDCKNAGLKVGAYWFLYPLSVADAKEQAQDCVKLLSGKSFDLPICLDFEEASVDYYKKNTGKTLTRELASQFVMTFCDTVAAAGYDVLIYTNYNMGNSSYGLISSACYDKYDVWLAQWIKNGVLSRDQINMVLSGETKMPTGSDPLYKNVRIWQFGKGDGAMFGIPGNEVDLNIIV